MGNFSQKTSSEYRRSREDNIKMHFKETWFHLSEISGPHGSENIGCDVLSCGAVSRMVL
jgi:hypothetical protein